MRILLFTEKMDYVKVTGVLVDDIDKMMAVEVVSECQLANTAISHPHDLIILDDRLYDVLKGRIIEVLSEYQIDVIVFLQKKDNINRYLTLNLLDYFVSPLKWDDVNDCLTLQIKRMRALNCLETFGQIPNKLIIKQKSSIHLVDYDNILFFQKDEKLVKIHTRAHIYESHDSLKHILKGLPENFVRVHSSFIVNFNNAIHVVEDHRTYEIYFKDYDGAAHMSRKKADEMLHDHINKYRLSYIKHHGKEI